jgi:hypothetical protein
MRKSRLPVKVLVNKAITPERARKLVELIAGDYSPELVEAMLELLAGVVDLEGDEAKADAGLNAIMQAYTYTFSFYSNLCDHVARTSRGSH